jgi:hypothetical protein
MDEAAPEQQRRRSEQRRPQLGDDVMGEEVEPTRWNSRITRRLERVETQGKHPSIPPRENSS